MIELVFILSGLVLGEVHLQYCPAKHVYYFATDSCEGQCVPDYYQRYCVTEPDTGGKPNPPTSLKVERK